MPRPLYGLAATIALIALATACTTGGSRDDSSDGSSIDVDGGGHPDGGLPADRCDVEPGAPSVIVYRGLVLTPDGPMLGEVATENELIACVGDDCGDRYHDPTVIDCGGAVISPALINPHDHMSFNERGPLDLDDTRYDHRHEWRAELGGQTRPNPSGTGRHQPGSLWVELRHLFGGTTTVVGSGNASDIIRHLDDLRFRDEDLGFFEVVYETFPLGDGSAHREDELAAPEDCDWNYRHDSFEASRFPAYIPHVAEGINDYAAEEFRCQSREQDGARDFAQPNASHIHSVGLQADDLHRMARAGTRLVWSPRSNIALYGMTADVSTFYRFGGTISISTDWAYTGSATMFRELACADSFNSTYLGGLFTERELWEMATINAAVSVGNEHRIGSLEEGKVADILIVNGEAGPYRSILEADSTDVLLVTVAGEAMYGDREILEGLGDPCDPIDVCGEARGVCLERKLDQVRPDHSMSYDELVASMESGAYPLFFCGTPPNEPTCVPSRPGEFSGIPTADDFSGDGVPNEEDVCPRVFHPIRPIDGGQQADFDDDGVGDPCDESAVPDDISGDGVPNDQDNCPYDHNPDQTDSSGDGRGDVCDACPDVYNPDTPCPPESAVTIREIYSDVASGEDVYVIGAVVTGVYDEGFTMQDPSPRDGPEQSGVLVFTFDRPNVEVGDVVDVQGRKDVFGGNVEVTGASVFRVRSGPPLPPIDVSVSQAASDAYQGVLVRITDGSVTDENFDCGCPDTDLWEISDGESSVIAFDRLYEDNDWGARVGERPIAGVIMHRFGENRVMPRSAADFP